MSAAEWIADPRALLDAMQARCDAAPPPPWRYREAAYGDPANGPDYTVLEALCAEEWFVIARGDYDSWSGYGLGFAADARSDLPRLIAAVRAVLEPHWGRLGLPCDHPTHDLPDAGCPFCAANAVCDECGDPWPCATYTAITTALGANHD